MSSPKSKGAARALHVTGLETELVAKFTDLAAHDGMTPRAAVAFLMRWAVNQGTLCPITRAEPATVSRLLCLRRELDNAMAAIGLPSPTDDDNDGEAWKTGGAS